MKKYFSSVEVLLSEHTKKMERKAHTIDEWGRNIQSERVQLIWDMYKI